MKLLVVLLALLLLVWLLVGSSRRRSTRQARRDPDAASAPASAAQVEGMVACAHCGVHLPSSLALTGRGQPYCSAAHRDAGPAKS